MHDYLRKRRFGPYLSIFKEKKLGEGITIWMPKDELNPELPFDHLFDDNLVILDNSPFKINKQYVYKETDEILKSGKADEIIKNKPKSFFYIIDIFLNSFKEINLNDITPEEERKINIPNNLKLREFIYKNYPYSNNKEVGYLLYFTKNKELNLD